MTLRERIIKHLEMLAKNNEYTTLNELSKFRAWTVINGYLTAYVERVKMELMNG
jgi:hypothetical protein